MRIIQQEPENDELNISAWIDQREVNHRLIYELVIDLELTEESQNRALLLLRLWLEFNFSYVEMIRFIEEICATTYATDVVVA